MANTNTEVPTVVLEESGKDGNEGQAGVRLNGEDLSGTQKSSGGGQGNSGNDSSTEKRTSLVTGDSKRTSSTTRPTLVQLGSSSTTAPQTKRFSAVNISKKFLEKNSPASAPSPSSQLTPLANNGSNAARPQAHPTISHSRLVTAKLTSISPASSTSAGWSRPSSAAPPNVAGSHSPAENSPGPTNTPLGVASNATGAPQLPHAGKVIQPQPKSAILASKLSTDKPLGDKSGKGVWGNVKANALLSLSSTNEFPTAAEVAQGNALARANRQVGVRVATEAIPSAEQAEADTFRGVHLDPNAHHWDEMEEDDDNFLDGVIEFGDGRQYKIEATEAQNQGSSADSTLRPEDSTSNVDSTGAAGDRVPIRKEDRFGDDIDRSWPRSRPPTRSTRETPTPNTTWLAPSGDKHPTSVQSQDGQSPTDAPRVLFNERSNRLEPYNNSNRPHRSSFHERDSAVSPSELRSPRDTPWGSRGGPASVQNEPPSRFGSRRFSNTSSTGSGSFGRDRDHSSTSPRLFKEPLAKEREFRGDKPRRSDMGPPPVPAHAFKGDNGRQPPSQRSPVTPHQPLAHGHPSPRDSRFQNSMHQGADPSYRSPLPPPSPALSHASAKASPSVPTHILPSLVTPQLETAQKDYMHTAAERAKERREREEADRERERERARQKAAELEARLKAGAITAEPAAKETEPAQEQISLGQAEAVAFLEDTIKSAQISEPTSSDARVRLPPRRDVTPPHGQSGLHDAATTHPSPPSLKPGMKPSPSFTKGIPSEVQSWRTSVVHPPSEQSKTKIPELSSNTAMDQVETLVATHANDLEVVDFSDMAKFLNGPEASVSETTLVEKRHPRAVASDFFDVKEISVEHCPATANETKPSWRSNSPETTAQATSEVESLAPSTVDIPAPASAPAKTTSFSNESAHHPLHTKPQKAQAPYKVAPMSALDDVMSRIKGALDGMHIASAEASSKAAPPKGRWVPPALRPRVHESIETLHTSDNPPLSPVAADSFRVSLPKTSKALEPVNRRQLILFSKPSYVRWEILSFDPPVEGMNKRDFSLNNTLFRRPLTNFKGQIKYRVHLPTRRYGPRPHPPIQGLKNGTNSLGRPAADGLSSWRKPKDSPATEASEQVLPPVPEVESNNDSTPITSQDKSEPAVQYIRPRALPKMPDGTGVAFYRDSRIDTVKEDTQPSVKFFVASELESSSATRPESPTSIAEVTVAVNTSNEKPAERDVFKKGVSSEDNTIVSWPPESIPPANKTEPKGASISADSSPMKSRSAWSRTSKDSSSRGPDPELLKAVWSQTSNQPGSHGVNSLEAIADDLTALPFTISEFKSEDGETPPAVVSGPPSRMSLHEVTRAFQQVPTASNSSSPRRSPPQATNITTQQRNPSASFSYQPQASNFRPGYHYPSPMMSHSPAPNMMYPAPMPPSPMPSQMQVNGSNHVYGQPMWMSPPGAQPQNGMMRPVASPYHAPLMYPPSGPYAPGGLHPPAQQPTGQINRDRPMPMVSPIMGHAAPAMYGSPGLMHAPMAPQNSGFVMPPAANHGPSRSENHRPIHQQRGHAQLNASFNYSPYERSGW